MKLFHNDVFDAGLNTVNANGSKMVLCKQPPTTFVEANNLVTDTPAGFKIAEVALVPADLVIADRTGGGREITVAAKPGVSALDSSQATDDLHIAILDVANSKLLVVTDETTDQAVTSGNQVNLPSFKFGFPDPV
ncbi:MAG TPA: hypothetical protein ENJ17_01380 [Gammaproteobacteria bacterium]|nr:hypothetical protein [Gammaproteobacteria bacterium]